MRQRLNQRFRLLLQAVVAAELLLLLLVGQKIKLKLFLHLLQLQQVELGFIASLLQLLLQRLDRIHLAQNNTVVLKQP